MKHNSNDIECLTPDAVFHTEITKKDIKVSIQLPMELNLDAKAAEKLEKQLHRAIEAVIANLFD